MKLDVKAYAEFNGQGVMAGVYIEEHEHCEPYISLAELCKRTVDAYRLVDGEFVASAKEEIDAMREQLIDALTYLDLIE